MKAFKRVISVMLALLIVAAGLAVGFSVSAATDLGTVTVTSNISDPVTVAYTDDTAQITVAYKLQAAKQIVNAQGRVTYDTSVLSVPAAAQNKSVIPVLREGSSTVNFNNPASEGTANTIKFNATDTALFDFSTQDDLFTVTFDVVGSGNTTVDLTLDVLTATNDADNPVSANDVYLVRYETVNTDETFALTAVATAADVDYYLFGYINGANYACEEDYTNLGDYKFVDGTLTATFTENSYVAVKSALNDDNYNWYMTDGWLGEEATSATLYNTSGLGQNANKLFVPANKEITFTLVNNGDDTFELSYVAQDIPEPTQEPTQEPTEPVTEPATEPSANDDVCVVGTEDTDFVLKLDSVGDSKYAGEMALPAGTYTFRMREGDQMLGYKGTITDAGNKNNSFTWNPAWSSSTTLTTNGGVFYFWYHKELNKFYMYRVEDIVDNYLVGDLNTVMRPVPGQNSAVGSMHLEAGTYKFRVSIRGVINGYSATINDSTNGASLTFENKWKAEITLNATGGTYSFYIINNTDTHKDYFQVKYIPDDPNQSKEDVHLTGDLSAILDDNNGESEEAVAIIPLDANTAYSFKVVDHGVTYTAGLTVTGEGTRTLSSLYTRTFTFNSTTAGTYEFRYNKTAHTITITPVIPANTAIA